jgi:uncharacterized protein (DUF697 family)
MRTRLLKPIPMLRNKNNFEHIVSAVLAGLVGGAALLSNFGKIGLIVGSVIGGIILGASAASEYHKNNNRHGKSPL